MFALHRTFLSAVCALLLTAHSAAFRLNYNGKYKHVGSQFSAAVGPSGKTKEDIPKWAGGGPVSQAVNALISFKPLFNLMKQGARNVLISTAEKNKVPWRQRARELQSKETLIRQYFSDVEYKELMYPDYYLQEFHAYDTGNLNFEAAYECESATYSMALRIWPTEQLEAQTAQDRLRNSYLGLLKPYLQKYRNSPQNILDAGCSVGISTMALAEAFPNARQVVGLDLSPHFLAVAKYRQQQESTAKKLTDKIVWTHQNMEKTSYSKSSFDLVSASFVFHELPDQAARNILSEAYRLLKPNGVFAMTDNNPKSAVIQNLPPALFTLMKSTEPWTDQYYRFDLEAALEQAGFVDVQTYNSDPRHRAILARKK